MFDVIFPHSQFESLLGRELDFLQELVTWTTAIEQFPDIEMLGRTFWKPLYQFLKMETADWVGPTYKNITKNQLTNSLDNFLGCLSRLYLD